MEEPIFQTRTDLAELNEAVNAVRRQIKKIIVGQDEMVRLIIVALLADGHLLVEGAPAETHARVAPAGAAGGDPPVPVLSPGCLEDPRRTCGCRGSRRRDA